MKKKGQSLIFYTLAIISLLFIGWLFGTGLLKNWFLNDGKNKGIDNILGETIESKAIDPLSAQINRLMQEATRETKEVTSQKLTEMEKAVSNTIQKEITNLTQSQLKAIQLHLCKDWGVISPSATNQPQQQ